MRRPRKFLHFIIILLVINAIFFGVWYGIGGRNWFRNLLSNTISKAIKAELSLGDLHISDRQLIANDILFATSDSLITVKIDALHVRYNLYKFLLSGFRYRGVVSTVEINNPEVTISYKYIEKPPKPKKEPFRLPDLTGYCKTLHVINGSVSTDLSFPVKIITYGNLQIEESLHHIDLKVTNSTITEVHFTGTSSMNGMFRIEGVLDKGRIDSAKADVQHFKPLYATHPDIQDFRTELSCTASYSEPSDGGKAKHEGKAIFWNTSAVFIDKYPVKIPFISGETDGKEVRGFLTRSSFGSSSIEAEVNISDYEKGIVFGASQATLNVDLGMLEQNVHGFTNVTLQASGTIDEPIASMRATSSMISYQDWEFRDISLNARYQDDTLMLLMSNALWENQTITLSGDFNPFTKAINASLQTSPIQSFGHPLIAKGEASVSGLMLLPYPMLEVKVQNVDFMYQLLEISDVNGYATLIPSGSSLFLDTKLSSTDGFYLNVVGDLLDQSIVLDAAFNSFPVHQLYADETLSYIAPVVSGSVSAIMQHRKIWSKSNLKVALEGNIDYRANLNILGTFDIDTISASASVKSKDGFYNNSPIDFDLTADYSDMQLKLWGLQLGDILNISGSVDLSNWQDMDFSLAIQNLTLDQITRFYPDLQLIIPEFKTLDFFADFNREGDRRISAWMNLNQIDLLSVVPLDLEISLDGTPEEIGLTGAIKTSTGDVIGLKGNSRLLPQIDLSIETALNDLNLQDILIQPPGKGSFSGLAEVKLSNVLSPARDVELFANIAATGIEIEGFRIDSAVIKAAQKSRSLEINTLRIVSRELFELNSSGALDYNLLKNEFFEGNQQLEIAVEGHLFPWLKNVSDFVIDSRGESNLHCKVSTSDDQFLIQTGSIDIRNGYLLLKDQTEAIRNIELRGVLDNNKLLIERGQCGMGNGRMIFSNVFDADQSDHFILGFLDLGFLRLMIDEPGIQATIPYLSPPRSLSSIALRGINSRYATVKGPFDDMKVSAHVIVSNTDLLFPPGADNLLNLINSVRSTGKKSDSDPVPLPFTLDLLVTLGETNRYVTYPTNLALQQGGFLHLIYDGNSFAVDEMFISSERGTVDLFGTVFQVDNITINMVDQQNIMNLDGSFYKRTPDGSTVTLRVTSSPDFTKNFFDRLELNLSSDNPSDRNITQVLSRLRYNKTMDELSQDQRQNLLQDEAVSLIGGNLNSTVLTPFLYPMENWIRRAFKLDSFSINAGFIQNLFTEYSANPSQLAQLTDMKHFTSEIQQFSSSILLNNLSVSMSKYLGYRMFIDYEFLMQEATDLQNETKLMVSHDTSLRMVLPKQFRLGYTFKYTPMEDKITHEIMLQKSLRFWGL